MNYSQSKPIFENGDFSSCDVFAHFPSNFIFISFVYLTLDDMKVKDIIANLQQALPNESYLSFNFQHNENLCFI
jgi:hypothetical protein